MVIKMRPKPDPSSIKMKQVRRQILSHLNILYPSGMRLEWLYNTVICFDETYDRTLFKKDVSYLKGKGYLRFADEPLGDIEWWQKVCILTEAGKDIADKTAVDETLEI